MSDNYSLRLYDTELMRFSLEKRGLDGLVANIISVQEEYAPLMPLDLEQTSEGIIRWLSRRVIPKNRTFVDQILKTLNLSHNDTKGIIDVCKGLSLNDSYWVVPEGFEGTFEAYNLYENRFSEILALVAYTGAGQSHEAFTTSPELTTSGMLPKAWRLIEGDGIFLYKGGTRGASNSGREPYCEAYASQIAAVMGLNAVHYDLENWKDITASKCRLFTDIDTAFIPAGRIVPTGGIQACLDYYDALGGEFGEQLRSMLVFDALIYNEDRHFGNFGLLRDNHTGKIIAPAPIFDNGLSLMAFAGKDDLDSFSHFETYAKMRTPPYQVSYEEICHAVMGPVQKAQLRRMIGFQFHRYPAGMVTEAHLDYLEKLLEDRVQELLNIPDRKHQKGSKEQNAR
ncbi:XRE family transcriptional regulator [bacterium 1xD42-67]|nr:XRE family transcriptional regulator [bacterium 1xD42-67]